MELKQNRAIQAACSRKQVISVFYKKSDWGKKDKKVVHMGLFRFFKFECCSGEDKMTIQADDVDGKLKKNPEKGSRLTFRMQDNFRFHVRPLDFAAQIDKGPTFTMSLGVGTKVMIGADPKLPETKPQHAVGVFSKDFVDTHEVLDCWFESKAWKLLQFGKVKTQGEDDIDSSAGIVPMENLDLKRREVIEGCLFVAGGGWCRILQESLFKPKGETAVSYTHLTLPTTSRV